MTHDLKVMGDKEFISYKNTLDSLYIELNDPENASTKTAIMQDILAKKQNIEDFSNNYSNEQSAKIWLRINSYAKDYSNSKGYDLILGAQPSSNIIFGRDNLNVTEDFLLFINSRYEGKN